MNTWLGLDLGTSSVKAILINETGDLLAQGKQQYAPKNPCPGWSEQDPEVWWQACESAVLEALGGLSTTVEIRGIGLCGQMHGTLLLDAEERLLAPAVLWSDQRSYQASLDLRDGWNRAGGVHLTGGPLAAGFQISTLQWFRNHEPELFSKIGKVVLPKDWLHWRLTGVWSTDPSDAAGTGLFDAKERRWSPALLSLVGVSEAQLPPVYPSTAVQGSLRREWSRRWSLPRDLPVTVGAGDTPCSLVGAAAMEPGSMLYTLSSGGQLVRPLSDYSVDEQCRLHTGCTPFALEKTPFRWFQMGATLHAGQAVRWLWGLVGGREEASFRSFVQLAERSRPGARGLLFVPYLGGERCPHMDGSARGSWLGLTLRHGLPELLRSVMEGVVFSCRDAMEAFSLNSKPEHLLLAGGGSQSPLWSQLVADITGLSVRRLLTEEQSAVGAAWLAHCATEGTTESNPPGAWVEWSPPLQPRADTRALYEEMFEVYKAQYAAQQPWFADFERWS